METLARGAAKFLTGFHLVKLALWLVFLTVFPPLCLLRGLTAPAVLLAGLGIVLSSRALEISSSSASRSRL